MQTQGSFDPYPSGYAEQGFCGLEYGSFGTGWSISNSPIQSFAFLPGGDLSSGRQSSSATNTTSRGGFVPMSSNFNHIPSGAHSQFNPRVRCYTHDSGATPNDTQTSHYPSVAFDSMGHADLRESMSSVVCTPSMTPYSIHNGSPDRARPHYGGGLITVGETHSSYPIMHPPYRQIQPTPRKHSILPNPANPTTVPLSPTTREPTRQNSRDARSTLSSPYRPKRASSTPIQSVSPNDMILHSCGWINDDGGLCMASISRSTISDHLITHGITKLGHDHHLSCRWVGCRLRGGREYMKRESIVRHIREKHLQYKRSSN